MIKSLRTALYPLADMARAKAWYRERLTCSPTFDEPSDLGFAVAGFELRRVADGAPGTGMALAYWGVKEAAARLQRLHKPQSAVPQELSDIGGGVRVAAVKDLLVNLFGIIKNLHLNVQDLR